MYWRLAVKWCRRRSTACVALAVATTTLWPAAAEAWQASASKGGPRFRRPPIKTAAAPEANTSRRAPTAQHATPAPRDQNAAAAAQEPSQAASEPLTVEAASFNGIQPGISTLAELQEAWGAPREISEEDGFVQHVYDIEPFKHVAVTIADERVVSLFIILEHAIASDVLAGELSLAEIDSVVVKDEAGAELGEAFPERGVLFSYAPGPEAKQVARIILEDVTPEPFIRRAESRLTNRYDAALEDLRVATDLDPQAGRAYWLRAQILSDTGNQDQALTAIEQALACEPDHREYRLCRAKILGQLDRFDLALAECNAVLGMEDLAPELKARAYAQLGDLIASGPDRDYKRAMEQHVQAIKLARPLAEDPRQSVRRAAKEVLVSAHLAVARDIAWGSWTRKGEVVPRWIEQADEIASAAIQAGDAPGDYRFRICQQALAAYVGMQGAADPTFWTKETLRTGRALVDQANDELYRSRLEWELGMTLYDAVQVYHMRRQYPQALEYGPLAVKYLEAAGKDRQQVPGQAYLMGRLYFRLGSIHLAHFRDHRRAIPWFNKAVPLMEEPIPDSALADAGRQGETFVSMAVSYWETGQRDEAVRLTTQGVHLMERAVEDEILQPAALTIAYGNLAAMHEELGETDKARRYDEMAARIEQTLQR